MLGRVADPGLFFQMDARTGQPEDAGLGWRGPSLAYRKIERLEKDERFLAWLSNPLFERVARARIPGGVVIYRAILFNKGRPGGGEIRWHQDGGTLWGLSQEPELQIWTALDDAPEDGGCLEVVPGSHRQGLARPMGGVLPEDALLAHGPGACRPLPVQAGEVVLLHNHLWHRSGPEPRGTPAARLVHLLHERGHALPAQEARAPGVLPRLRGRVAIPPSPARAQRMSKVKPVVALRPASEVATMWVATGTRDVAL